jgi:hypothetical protein
MWGLASGVAVAAADPYTPPDVGVTEPAFESAAACPVAPLEAYEGTDDAAGELRLLRGELSEVCDALTAGDDEVAHRLWWFVTEAIQDGQRQGTHTALLEAIRDRLDPPVEARIVGVSDPLPTEEAAGAQYNGDLVAAVDASGAAVKEGVWFLIGLAVSCLAGYGLYRQVMPRA